MKKYLARTETGEIIDKRLLESTETTKELRERLRESGRKFSYTKYIYTKIGRWINGHTPKEILVTRGIIYGGMSILITVVTRALNLDINMPWIELVLHLFFLSVFIYFGLDWHRYAGGKVDKKSALTIGIGIAIISSFLNGIYQFIYLNLYNQEFANLFKEVKYNILLETTKLTNAEVQMELNSLFTDLYVSAPYAFIRIFLVTLIGAIFISFASLPGRINRKRLEKLRVTEVEKRKRAIKLFQQKEFERKKLGRKRPNPSKRV